MAVNTIGAGVILNEGQIDVDFRVEGNNNANVLMVDGSADSVGIGIASPAKKLHVLGEDDGNLQLRLQTQNSSSGLSGLELADQAGVVKGTFSLLESDNTIRIGHQTDYAMFFDQSGNVGIGKTPTKKLSVEIGSTDDGGIDLSHSSGTVFARIGCVNPGVDNNTSMGSVSNNGLNILTNNATRMHITAAGNVGINETSPDTKLHVTGQNSYTTANIGEVSGLGFVRFQPNGNSEDSLWIHNGGGVLGLQASTNADSSTAENITLNAYGGSVGIGLTAPSVPLQVNGNIALGSNASAGTAGKLFLEMYNSNDSAFVHAGEISVSGTAFNSDATSDSDMNFKVMANKAQVTAMVLKSSGNVLIGTTADAYPACKFQSFTTTASSYAISARHDGGAVTSWGMNIICGTDDASGTNVALNILDGNGDGQGDITFSGGTVSYGTFTANHDAELPESDNEDGYPYGTLVEHTGIFYKKNGSGEDFERGILYKAQKSTSAYAKNVLGAYSNKYKDVPDEPENLHQIYVLGDGHILCNGEKGNIEIGDGVCTSSTDGEGMKADKMTMIIGIAQEDVSFDGSESKLVAVQYGLSQFTPW